MYERDMILCCITDAVYFKFTDMMENSLTSATHFLCFKSFNAFLRCTALCKSLMYLFWPNVVINFRFMTSTLTSQQKTFPNISFPNTKSNGTECLCVCKNKTKNHILCKRPLFRHKNIMMAA